MLCYDRQINQVSWIRFFTQAYTWGPFRTSDKALKRIFTAHRIAPSFIGVLHAFGHPKDAHDDISCLGFDLIMPPSNDEAAPTVGKLVRRRKQSSPTDLGMQCSATA